MRTGLALSTVDVGGAVSDMLRSVLLFVPKLLLFLAILIIGWIVAKLLRRAVDKVLERVGFDNWVERGGVKTALAKSRYDASQLVSQLVYWFVLLFTLQLAFGVWGPNPISDLIHDVVAWLPRAFVAIVIVVVAAAIAGWVRDLISSALSGLSYGRLLANVAAAFIVGLGIVAALNQIGVATTVTTPVLIAVLATIAGVLVVGVGGGLIRPMQQRWEGWLGRAEQESAVIAEQAKAYAAAQQETKSAQQETKAAQPEAKAVEQPVPVAGEAKTEPAGDITVPRSEPVQPYYATGVARTGTPPAPAPRSPQQVPERQVRINPPNPPSTPTPPAQQPTVVMPKLPRPEEPK